MRKYILIITAVAVLAGCKGRPAQDPQPAADPNLATIEASLRDACITPETFRLVDCKIIGKETLGDQIADREKYFREKIESRSGFTGSYWENQLARDKEILSFLEGVRAEQGSRIDDVVATIYQADARYKSPLVDVEVREVSQIRVNEKGEITAVKDVDAASWTELGSWFSIPGYEAEVMKR